MEDAKNVKITSFLAFCVASYLKKNEKISLSMDVYGNDT